MNFLYFLYWLCLPICVIIIKVYNPKLKNKIIILVIGVCFIFVPFTNIKPAPKEIKIITDPALEVVLGKDMTKKLKVTVEPKNANEKLIEFASDDYSVAYIEDESIHSLHEGETYVYAECKGVRSNQVKVIVDYSHYIDFNDEGVYITKNGTRYHTFNCSTINPEVKKITLEEAKNMGAEPCKSCFED